MLNPYESPASVPDHPPARNESNRLVIAWLVGTLTAAAIGVTAGIGYQLAWVSCAVAIGLPVAALRLVGAQQTSFLLRLAIYAAIGWSLCYLLQPVVSGRRPQPPTPPSIYIACHGIAGLLTGVGVAFECRKQLQNRSH